VVIDYLQLMSSGKKVESRQQEVSEFSRALKLLAKELEVPVIAISQLNRGPEQRTDKRPQMSDLRESGCLPADTKILRADTGAEVTLGELYASGERDIEVWALDESLRYVRRPMTHVFSTGVAPVFRLTLASGKTVRATENHPFHTYDGWLPLAALRTGTRVAVPRHVYAPRALTEWDDARAVALAREVAAGQAVVGADVFALPKPQIALFVASLFEAAGSVVVGDDNEGRISLPVCRAAADVTTRLLLRFGIQTRIAGVGTEVVLDVDGVDSQRRFLQEIGLGARDQAAAATLLASVRAAGADPALHGSDDSVWHNVSAAMSTQDVGAERETGSGAAVLTRITELLDSADLDLSAVNDVFWDEVVSVVPAGIEEVFDATVLGTHNFVADGVAVHNSIEQDADVVILLHKDKEREGEADVLVVKHRNGPTKDLVLGFQGHYARFSNMAASGGF
jgi:replicative DNA helicase